MRDILAGEVAIPELLKTFFDCLICGPHREDRPTSEKKKRRIESMAADDIFCVTNGKSMPSKHLQVGLVMKAVTGSRKTLEMLNRLGHCASYHTVEGLETELTYSVSDAQRLLPDGLAQLPDLHTGVAYDNYDRYVDTLSGRNTLHITVGIIYQDNPGKAIISTLLNPDKRQRNSSVPGSRKRRAYEVPGFVLEPY